MSQHCMCPGKIVSSVSLVAPGAGNMKRFGIFPRRRSGEMDDLVPGGGKFVARSGGLVSFRGEIGGLVPALGRISRFGTREGRAGESRPGVSPGTGNQIAEVGRNRGTKPRFLTEFGLETEPGVPNCRLWQHPSYGAPHAAPRPQRHPNHNIIPTIPLSQLAAELCAQSGALLHVSRNNGCTRTGSWKNGRAD